jgi:hypothetical protein
VIKLGSLIWRINNYGLPAVIRYIVFRRLKTSNKLENFDQFRTLEALVDRNNPNTEGEEKGLILNFNRTYDFIVDLYSDFVSSGNRIKNNIIGNGASSTKFKVLAYLIEKNRFDLIIETGTQYGTTALFMDRYLQDNNIKCDLVTIDVEMYPSPKHSSKLIKKYLKSPGRKNFKILTKNLVESKRKILFFHDSDHTYENMLFEFRWAWNQLDVFCIVSDDIENNSAFIDFAHSIAKIPIICKFDFGPAVGILQRD